MAPQRVSNEWDHCNYWNSRTNEHSRMCTLSNALQPYHAVGRERQNLAGTQQREELIGRGEQESIVRNAVTVGEVPKPSDDHQVQMEKSWRDINDIDHEWFLHLKYQGTLTEVSAWGDADHAGCVKTRKARLIKSYIRGQAEMSTSSVWGKVFSRNKCQQHPKRGERLGCKLSS